MFEKVNPMHPDKIADRIAGAIVDFGYKIDNNLKIACEVLIGHGLCTIIIESSVEFDYNEIKKIIDRISNTKNIKLELRQNKQDEILANNQIVLSCGDNGIFKGVAQTNEQKVLTKIAKEIYDRYKTDGKYIYVENKNKLIICQSNVNDNFLNERFSNYDVVINPLGNWVGGLDVDTGATNRKLGSDMGDSVTGGGIHGKDLSKADVSLNIYCQVLAEKYKAIVTSFCAISDKKIEVNIKKGNDVEVITVDYSDIVNSAKEYVDSLGGFEKMAEWGFV